MYRDSIFVPLLEKRLTDMELTSGWRVFAALAVDYLGMPADAMPFYVDSGRYGRKARRVIGDFLALIFFEIAWDKDSIRDYMGGDLDSGCLLFIGNLIAWFSNNELSSFEE